MRTGEQKRRLVVANFFPAFTPPSSGGEQRYFYLYRHLSRYFDITLVSATYSSAQEELVEHSLTFREYRVPKPPESDRVHWELIEAGIGEECSGYVVALCSGLQDGFRRTLNACIADADAVVHECPFTAVYDEGIGTDGRPRIYNAYNVEARLAQQMLRGPAGEKAARFIGDVERYLVSECALLFVTSEEERQTFIRDYAVDSDKIHLAPNGYEEGDTLVDESRSDDAARHDVVFLGSQHPPNVEALDFIVTQLAPATPTLRYRILGSVVKAYAGRTVPANVDLLGFVSAKDKSELLGSCAAAINPLFSGAGTNLKMLDYMAHGVAVVTTPVGARGLLVVSGVHVEVVSAEGFAKTLLAIAGDRLRAAALGGAARALAREHYSWQAIADGVALQIDGCLKRNKRLARRKLLSVCDYPVDAPAGGGQVRIRELLLELGREFDVTYLCLTEERNATTRKLGFAAAQHAFPKSERHLADQAHSSNHWVSIADVVSARHCLSNAPLVEAFRSASAQADLVLFEQCYLAPLLEYVPQTTPVIYSSQNDESSLKLALLEPRADCMQVAQEVRELENRLLQRAQLVVCVSQADAAAFSERCPSVSCIVVENGVRVPDNGVLREHGESGFGKPLAVFVGSAHPPNVKAVQFIVESLAAATPDVLYGVIGSVCDGFQGSALPENVLMLGFLSPDEKSELLRRADFAVNPMFDGGGSSLKVADFFAAGLPVVSSRIGMRGYDAQPGRDYLASDPADFVTAVRSLMDDARLRARIGANAYRLAASQLDWRVLGGKLRRALRDVLPQAGRVPRLLVLTYRFGEPSRGGAEVFLAKVLGALRHSAEWNITVAAPAVSTIQNHWMFSALYEPLAPGDRVPVWADDVRFFPLDPVDPAVFQECRRLHTMWMEESRALAARFVDRFPAAALAGGWHHPESSDQGACCWTSLRSRIKVPPGARRVIFSCSAPQRLQMEFLLDGHRVHKQSVRGASRIAFAIDDGDILELVCSAAHRVDGDPRELGVYVRSISFEMDEGSTREVALAVHDLDWLRDHLPMREWVAALIDTANARDPADDALFLKVRGPHSCELHMWLEAHVADYDVVLAQGVPFTAGPLGVQVARTAGVPVVILPHAHIEDRYYHWQSFYTAYREATCVVAAPEASLDAFYSRINANAIALPGGGVEGAEFEEKRLQQGRLAFRAIYPRARPFVLVLGRKADGKNYGKIIEAHAVLRKQGHLFDLVMIGPDDDGRPVSGEGLTYLGPQPREVVVGALAEARCLATMSESESFGIVLLEAWLAGTPVVANAACAAFRELVADGDDGFLADGLESLQNALEIYASQPELAAAHARNGRGKALGYEWRRLAESLSEVLVGVLPVKRAGESAPTIV